MTTLETRAEETPNLIFVPCNCYDKCPVRDTYHTFCEKNPLGCPMSWRVRAYLGRLTSSDLLIREV